MSTRKVSIRLDEDVYNDLMLSAEMNNKTLSHEIKSRLGDMSVMQLSDDNVCELRSILLLVRADLLERNRIAQIIKSDVKHIASQLALFGWLSGDNNEIAAEIADFEKREKQESDDLLTVQRMVDALWQSLK